MKHTLKSMDFTVSTLRSVNSSSLGLAMLSPSQSDGTHHKTTPPLRGVLRTMLHITVMTAASLHDRISRLSESRLWHAQLAVVLLAILLSESPASGQVCYQFSDAHDGQQPTWVATLSVASIPTSLMGTGGSYAAAFTSSSTLSTTSPGYNYSPENVITVTFGGATYTFNEFTIVINTTELFLLADQFPYPATSPAGSSFSIIAGLNISPSNLFPDGLTASLPPLSAWTPYVSLSPTADLSVLFAAVTSIGSACGLTQTTLTGPALSITKSHTANFVQGQTGAIYGVTVSNLAGAATSSGPVTVTEMLPQGLSMASMSGTGWSCGITSCTRSDALSGGDSYPRIMVSVNVAQGAPAQVTNQVSLTSGGAAAASASDLTTITGTNLPTISSGGIVPINGMVAIIQPGEWVSIYGTNLATSTVVWNGNFPTALGGTSVTINNKLAYLWYVSPTQINLQAPDDNATGSVNVVVTTPSGAATSIVTLGQFGPSFNLLDGKHVAGIIIRSDESGAYGGGAYDVVGPTGTSLGYKTVAAKAGDTLELFGVGFGPTSPVVSAGKAYSGAAPTTNSVQLLINGVAVSPSFSGITSAGLYQINLQLPSGVGTGDVPMAATVAGVQTPSGVVLSVQ
jgi:uncharacterized protein (TIGR03437 family)